MNSGRFRFYRDQPVKHMRRDGDTIVLTMVGKVAGQPGRQLRISQTDWDTHGEWRDVPSTRMADIRNMIPAVH